MQFCSCDLAEASLISRWARGERLRSARGARASSLNIDIASGRVSVFICVNLPRLDHAGDIPLDPCNRRCFGTFDRNDITALARKEGVQEVCPSWFPRPLNRSVTRLCYRTLYERAYGSAQLQIRRAEIDAYK